MWPQTDRAVCSWTEQNELTMCLETPETERKYIPRPTPLAVVVPPAREPVRVRRDAKRTTTRTAPRQT